MNYRDELEAGRDAFGHLIKVWHERNGWSQRVLPALAERLELGRVHNSQLSNLRNRKLASPGPELFVALGRINQLLAEEAAAQGLAGGLAEQLADQPELLSALQASALPLLADDGAALGPAQLFEIFVGLRPLPAGFDLRIQLASFHGLFDQFQCGYQVSHRGNFHCTFALADLQLACPISDVQGQLVGLSGPPPCANTTGYFHTAATAIRINN